MTKVPLPKELQPLTSSDLRRFAEAGGWYALSEMPDFENDLEACFKVLEHYPAYTLTRVREGYTVQIGIGIRSLIHNMRSTPASTKQEAIIRAVLALRTNGGE